MSVLGVQSKRERRPNVRLGEIGAISAVTSCGNSWKHREIHEPKNPKHPRKSSKEIDFHINSGCILGNIRSADSDPGASSGFDTHNRENKNPNSVGSASGFSAFETDVNNGKWDFRNITRKSRVSKRLRDSCNIGTARNSRISSEAAVEDDKGGGQDVIREAASNTVYDIYSIEELKDPMKGKSPELNKFTYGNELTPAGPILDITDRDKSGEFWTGNGCKERIESHSDAGHGFVNKIGEDRKGFHSDDDHNFAEEKNKFQSGDEFWTGNVCERRIKCHSDVGNIFVNEIGEERKGVHSEDAHNFAEEIAEVRNGFHSDDVCPSNNKITEVNLLENGDAFVPNVREWLETVGLGKYARIFELHEVDVHVLPLLTFDDLKEMGIDAVGTRRKMFTAIQRLKDRHVTAQ